MTCIAGLVDGESVYVGSDSESTWGYVRHDCGSKVIRCGDALLAWTGLSAVAVALRHRLAVPDVPEGGPEKWLLVTLPDTIRKVLRDSELWDNGKGRVREGGALIVGWRGHLVSCDSYLAAYPATRGYIAHGSGGEVAMGSLYTTEEYEVEAEERLRLAIMASTAWSVGVGGDPHIGKV